MNIQAAARLRMFRLAGAGFAPDSVAAWDRRTSMDDARIALQLAHGIPGDDLTAQGYERTAVSA